MPDTPLLHPDLGVRPPDEPLPAPLRASPGALPDLFSRWLRQRDDAAHPLEKALLVRALSALSDDDARRLARAQAALAAPAGWTHWTRAVPAATVAALLGLPMDSLADQRRLLDALDALAAGLSAQADAAAVRRADGAVQALLEALRAAEARAPDAPLQAVLLHHAPPSRGADRASLEANRLALIWQSFEAGASLLGHALIRQSQGEPMADPVALLTLARDGGAVRLTRRFAQRNTTVGGCPLARGDAITVPLAGTDTPFGDGAHRCPGQHLALVIVASALSWAADWSESPPVRPAAPQILPNLEIPRFHDRAELPAQETAPMIAVIFEVMPAADGRERYLALAAELKPLLQQIDGFVSIERFQSLSDPDKLLSLSFWRDEDAVRRWRALEAHRAAQSEGRGGVFADYRLRVAAVLRDYGMRERDEAPADSRARHDGAGTSG